MFCGPPKSSVDDNLTVAVSITAMVSSETIGHVEPLAVGESSTPRGLWPTGILASDVIRGCGEVVGE